MLTQQQMAELFDVNKTSVLKHIKNIYTTNELSADSTSAIFAQFRIEGNREMVRNYGLLWLFIKDYLAHNKILHTFALSSKTNKPSSLIIYSFVR